MEKAFLEKHWLYLYVYLLVFDQCPRIPVPVQDDGTVAPKELRSARIAVNKSFDNVGTKLTPPELEKRDRKATVCCR